MSIPEQIKQLENEYNYLYDMFTKAAHSKSEATLKQMCAKKAEILQLKQQLVPDEVRQLQKDILKLFDRIYHAEPADRNPLQKALRKKQAELVALETQFKVN